MKLSLLELELVKFSLIDVVGQASVLKIAKHFSKEAQVLNFASLSLSFWTDVIGLQTKTASKIVDAYNSGALEILLEKELELCEKLGVRIISIFSDEYPIFLKEIHSPPAFFYLQGSSCWTDKCLAVVGSRKAESYHKLHTKNIVEEMVLNGWTIVSGGAEGIDTVAHQAALQQAERSDAGKTVVVLGSGFLHIYPACNKELFKQVVRSGGAVLSLFPMNSKPEKINFPIRNRVIAGMSQGCFVSAAAIKSGSLITANFALEENRDVFALPGAVDNEFSKGCHELIKKGAILVESAEDILENYLTKGYSSSLQKSENFKQSVVDEKDESLDFSQKVLRILIEPKSVEELSHLLKLGHPTLLEILFDLELDGSIRQNFNGTWEKISK